MAIDTQYTVYAITDRRALIVRNGLRPDVVSCPFERMDATPEIMTAGGRGGHLYFASDMSTKLRDVDYTGKLAFRDLADVQMAAGDWKPQGKVGDAHRRDSVPSLRRRQTGTPK